MPKKRALTPQEAAVCARLRRIWAAKAPGLGLTQELAAEALGMSQGAVSHYLNGRNALGVEATLRWAKLLGVPPTEINPAIDSLLSPSAMALAEPAPTIYFRRPRERDSKTARKIIAMIRRADRKGALANERIASLIEAALKAQPEPPPEEGDIETLEAAVQQIARVMELTGKDVAPIRTVLDAVISVYRESRRGKRPSRERILRLVKG
ncbi:MAG: helix-turn-helix transcriptional regulator [Sinobacteraceae bacterium]|nr:helix-turn-helix transcriptional regulator [Nevskiaceae bacterium]